MKLKSKKMQRIYRQALFLVFFTFGTSILLFLLILFLIFRNRIFEENFISDNTRLILVCCFISLLIVSQGIALLWSKRIIKPANIITQAINNVAQGNFDVEIDTSDFNDDLKVVGEVVNKMICELKSMEVMREDFVSNVSHEFRAPLSAIQGYVTLLSSPVLSTSEKEAYFDLLTQSTHQLSDLVDNVLKLSRLDSQNIIQQSEKFRLDEQIRCAILLYEKQWSKKNLELELELPVCAYVGNEKMLNQIWVNLIGNAVKFTDNGGKISVRIDTSPADAVIVTISDTGIGMSDDVQKHIFERFYQGDTSRKSHGNGLGLAIVKKIADLIDCEISVNSTLGVGSTFTVTLKQ